MRYLFISLLCLTACGDGESPKQSGGTIVEFELTLKDGRVIECISYEQYMEDGMDCNWANPLQESAR